MRSKSQLLSFNIGRVNTDPFRTTDDACTLSDGREFVFVDSVWTVPMIIE
jgi:hypothetical protein